MSTFIFEVIYWYFAILFATTCLLKIIFYSNFLNDLPLLLPRWFSKPKLVASSVIAMEAGILVSLLLARNQIFPFVLAIAAMVLFSGVIYRALKYEENVSCNCFGRQNHILNRADLIRNLLIICAGIIAIGLTGNLLPLGYLDKLILSGLSVLLVIYTMYFSEILELQTP